MALALCLAGAGCTPPACADGTFFVTLTLRGPAQAADGLDIFVGVDGQPPQHRRVARPRQAGTDLVQIGFAGRAYPAGHAIALTIDALAGDVLVASAAASFTAQPDCSALGLLLGAAPGADSGAPDDADGGVPDGAPGDSDGGGSLVQLLALTPELANTGATLTLEGSFGPTATVRFPGGVTQAAAVLGPHRAQVVVPALATDGDLTVTSNGATSAPLHFRRAPFALGLQPFQTFLEQGSGPQETPRLATPRWAPGVVRSGKYLYAVGGELATDSSFLGGVERATIQSDGTISPFTALAGTGLVTARAQHSTVVIGQSLYVLGGWSANGASHVQLSSVERAAINADGSLSAFATVGDLVTPRTGAVCVVLGNYLYVLGGFSSSYLTSVERATILPDGSLSPFAVVPDVNLVTGRERAASVVLGNYLYVLSGIQGGTTVERATILPDGSLGPFTLLSTNLAVGRDRAVALPLGDSLYLFGMQLDGTPSTSVERATIAADGSLSAFALVPDLALPAALSFPSAALAGDRLWVIGGSSTDGTVSHASVNASGALGAFAASADVKLATPRTVATGVTSGEHVYAIGGANSSFFDSVEHATLAAGGTLSSFNTLPVHLVTARDQHLSVVLGDQLYVLGGYDGTNYLSSVERATIQPDGSLSAFATVTNVSLTTARAGLTGAVVGNYLYLFGGRSSLTGVLGSIERATIGANHSLSSFESVTGSLAVPRFEHSSVVLGGAVYLLGGLNSSSVAIGSIEKAVINADGSLGTFASAGTLSVPRTGQCTVLVGSSLYLVGGNPGVDRATIGASGAPGAFAAVSGFDLVTPRRFAISVLAGDLLSVIGGNSSSGQALDSVEQSALQP